MPDEVVLYIWLKVAHTPDSHTLFMVWLFQHPATEEKFTLAPRTLMNTSLKLSSCREIKQMAISTETSGKSWEELIVSKSFTHQG